MRRSLYKERRRGSRLPLLESFSRNVGLRRANRRNRWVLSTNPDMVFVTRSGRSLTEVCRELQDGYYATPRYELPESLWESFDRNAPRQVLEEMRQRGEDERLHLAVRGDPWNGYDAPGDFQLMPLRDALGIGGFHEGMVRGWHVDSNLAKRMSLLYNRPAGLLHHEIYAYHMMHLRALTSGHTGKAVREANSLKTFVDRAAAPLPADQPGDWGAPDQEIERISLVEKRRPFWMLGQAESSTAPATRSKEPEFADYNSEKGYNTSWHASLERIQFYLANAFDHLPRGLKVCAWSGNRGFQDFMKRVAWEKGWDLSMVAYSPQGRSSASPELNDIVPEMCIFDFTVHFLQDTAAPAELAELRAHFHMSLVAELSTVGDWVGAGNYRANPILYCLGVTHTELEGFISSATPDWDQIALPLGYKRGRFSLTDRDSRLGQFVKWQSARVRMAARLQGRKKVRHRIALECLRFVGRFAKRA